MIHQNHEAFLGWMRTTWMPYTHQVPEPDREVFIRELAERYLVLHPVDPTGRIHVNMVRLEVEACKS